MNWDPAIIKLEGQKAHANIFSHLVGGLVLLAVSSAVWKLFSVI